MSAVALALALKPLVFLAIFALPVYLLRRWLPDGFLKRLLLLEIHNDRHYTLAASWRELLRDRKRF